VCAVVCSGTVGCGLQRRWTAGYIGNSDMTKYALSEEWSRYTGFEFFLSLSILYYWHENCEICLCFHFTPSPYFLAIIHRRGVQSHRVDQAEVSNASRVCRNIKLWELQSLFIECSTF
jgi:hypothetical protein